MAYKRDKINHSPWRPRVISSPHQLLENFVAYAHAIESQPLKEELIFTFENQIVRETFRRARPLTLSGFCIFLGVTPQAWRYWRRNRRDLSDTIELIENAIFAQKFEGAAAGIFKCNIISRELGAFKRR